MRVKGENESHKTIAYQVGFSICEWKPRFPVNGWQISEHSETFEAVSQGLTTHLFIDTGLARRCLLPFSCFELFQI